MKQELASQLNRFMIAMRSMVNLLITALRISGRFIFMFLEGEKLRDIKSMCLVLYGNYLHKGKKIDKSITCYSKATDLNPNNFYAYGGLTYAYIEKHMFQEAQEYCMKAIKLKKSNVKMKVLQIIIYESSGQITLANETIEQIQTLFDNNLAATHNRLAGIYFKIGMFRQAEDHCKKAVDISPDKTGLHYNLARVYLAQSNYEMARIEFQKVVHLDNDKSHKEYAIKILENMEKKMRAKD